MRFSTITIVLSLAITSFAAPAPKKSSKTTSAATAAATGATGAAAAVLTATTYSDFQVSDGVGGSALAEVNAKFPVRYNPTSQPMLNSS